MSEAEAQPEGRWDSYLCEVDGAPASIFLDLSCLDGGVPVAAVGCSS